jgi:hypothetical protein
MKLNKWTLGLAALGLVSLTLGVRAQSTNAPAAPAPIPLTTALSATTISGYVDTSMVWNPGTGNANTAPYAFNAGKQDGFNLDSALIQIQRMPDTSKWAAGYTLSLQAGSDVVTKDAIRQAYVELMVPVGNGIDLEIGQWDNIIGYESNDDYKNPNWSRSYGYSIEPTTHTGVLGTYKFSDAISLQLGVANSLDELSINGRNESGAVDPITGTPTTIESKKALVSLLSLTAPDSWGSLKGSMFYVGLDYGPGTGVEVGGDHAVDKTHLYVGTTINTPVKGLTFGAAWDSVNNYDNGAASPGSVAAGPNLEGYATAIGVYASYALTDKATLNARAEYFHTTIPGFTMINPSLANGIPQDEKIIALTGTFQYQLWDNVTSRLEARWDNSANGYPQFGGTTAGYPDKVNEFMLAANIIYKF